MIIFFLYTQYYARPNIIRMSQYIRLLRPHHWIKNSLVFTALIFADKLFDAPSVFKTCAAFSIFSLAASSVYIFNDIKDKNSDQKHPTKRSRPIASNKIPARNAFIIGILLLGISLLWAIRYDLVFFSIICSYLALNIAYSLWLKRVVFIDVLCIAIGFVLRAISGAVIINVIISPWLLICTFLLMLYVAIIKRRQEIVSIGENNAGTRKILASYSVELIDQIVLIVLANTLMAYVLYTFNSVHSSLLLLTVPVVFYGIFRYLFLVQKKQQGEDPVKLVMHDAPLQITLCLWIMLIISILYLIPKYLYVES